LEFVGTPTADDDGVALGLQSECEGEADATGGARDEDCVAGNVHASTVGDSQGLRQRPLIQGPAIPGSVCTAADTGSMDRVSLADFLRHRRETLRPEDVGLSAGARRRAPGLRREEVAGLAAMSTDYYTRLEQRRGPQPSDQMLAALARALRLTSDERDYLFH